MYQYRKIWFCYLLTFIILSSCISIQKIHAQTKLIPFQGKDSTWGYKDEKGYVVIEPQFQIAGNFSPEGIAAVLENNDWLYIDTTGRRLLKPFIYDNGPDYFKEGLARFMDNSKFGFFNKYGKIIIEGKFDFALSFYEGLAAVCMGCKTVSVDEEHSKMVGGKWGYINKEGKIVIPMKFEYARPFEYGRALVCINGEEKYINKKGNFIK